MSLNGLDTPAVQEAHQSAVAEPGGWFLLKYISRDAVELHGRGKGGVHEARLAIAKYEEASPLYGLLIYRRRKVLVKYIPVGTSRVLQARTAVHFQDVAERYSPYETLLEITTAEGLNDTSLAASFPLHTASLSASSSRLHEISEDAEDSGGASRRPTVQNQNSGAIFGTRQYKMEKRVDQIMRPTAPPSIHIASGGDGAAVTSSALSPGKTSIASQILVREDSGKRSITSLSSPLSDSLISQSTNAASDTSSPAKDTESRSSLASELSRPPRISSTSQRNGTQESNNTAAGVEPLLEESSLRAEKSQTPPTSRGSDTRSHSERIKTALEEPFDFSYLEPKPKVRLAPRPVSTKRATTSAVSTLPAHYRPQAKKQDFQTTSPISPSSLTGLAAVPVPPIPAAPEYNPRPISRGSVKSLPSHKSTTMTPDKIRLMKAVELRKRQLRKSNPQLPSAIPGVAPDAPDVPRIPEQISEQPKQEAKEEQLSSLPNRIGLEDELLTKKADSGIEMNYPKAARPESKEEETKAESSTAPSQEPAEVKAEAPEDAATVEALRNDELRAEAEGYGSVPEPIAEDKQPRLPAYQSPRTVVEATPSSTYSNARTDYPEAVVQPAQEATIALNNSALGESSTARVPTITMSPGSPLEATHPHIASIPAAHTSEEPVSEDEGGNDNLETQQSPRRQNSDLAKRRRGIVEPLNLETQTELLSDDELMDELQEATVSEAKSIEVARSPVNAYFPRRPSNISLVSAQSRRSSQSASARTVNAHREQTADELEKDEGLAEPMVVRRSVSPMNSIDTFAGLRRNVGAGITKRFQALTEHRDVATTPVTVSPAQSQDGSPNERRIKSPPRSRTSSFKGRWGTGERAGSTSTIASTPENAPVWSIQQDSTNNRDSIHVRARIIRPPSGLVTHAETPDVDENSQIQQSKLEISHNVGSEKPLPSINTTSGSTTSPTGETRSRKQSLPPQSTQFDDFPTPPSRSVTSPTSDDASTINNNTGSRTSRFFKRMSSLGGSKRRSAAAQSIVSLQSPVDINSAASVKSMRTVSTITEKDRSDMPPAAALGDLNVQFPDTLLWKRRWLTIDDFGNLVISVQAADLQRAAPSRKHHLSEFKLPFIPDLDRQEMPHSICLEFSEGGTLQIACEDGMGQRQVLSMLRSYWKSWVG